MTLSGRKTSPLPRLIPVLLFAGALVRAGGSASAQEPPPPAPRPNIVYILADDLGYGDLGCHGSPIIRTPVLDRLAAEGMRFTDCYAAAPVCSPSRAGIMTGRNPNRLGIRDWIPENSGIYLKKSETTVAELLKGAGYRTGFTGKWHLNSRMDGSEPTPGDHGFDHWFATQNNAAPTHENPVNFLRNGKPAGPLQGNSSTLIAEEGIRFIQEASAKKDQPFALFVWFHAPHEPVATPKEWTDRYSQVQDATKRTYYGSVSLMDHEIGRLLEAVDAAGARQNTLVVFTSDNGPETLKRYKGAVNSHGSAGPLRGMKLHMHEGGYLVPGIVRWPARIRPGQYSEEPVNGTDVLPTLCEVAGAKLPENVQLDGSSITPAFDGTPVQRTRPLYWQYDKATGPMKLAVRNGMWKLLADEKMENWEFYNLKGDPAESRNLADRRDERGRMERMKSQLKRAHADINRPEEP